MSKKWAGGKSLPMVGLSDRFAQAAHNLVDENHPAWLGMKLAILKAEDGSTSQNIPIALLRFLSISEIKALQKAKKDKEADFTNMLLQLIVERAIEKVDHIIAYCQEQMAQLLDQIAVAEELLESLRMQDLALKDVINDFRENGTIEWSKSGHLENEVANAALQTYLQKHQINLNTDTLDIYLLLLHVRADVQQQTDEIKNQTEADTQTYEVYRFNWEKAEAIKNDLESGDKERQLAALNAIEELEKDMQIALTVKAEKSSEAGYAISKEKILNTASLTEEDLSPIDLLSDLEPLEEGDDPAVPVNSTPKL